jgi:arginine/lysine/ornithine decarboxylase
MNQQQTPLYDALANFSQNKPVSFHVPGHKNGLYFAEKAKPHFHSLLEIDVTELTGLDDLHDPSECIREAEILLADLYGADKSYFLVNGSTVGNLAMILAVCEKDDTVLVQRNCHKSVMNGLQLAGAHPVFLNTSFDKSAYVPTGVAYETVKAALKQYPMAKAIILTHPSYYGISQDLRSIITLAHEHGIPVLVDEAHGAHFCLGAPFPSSALAYGADAVVHSAHKTLPAMTMGSYLHVKSTIIKTNAISRYLHMLQSSSPSYPIMASLDLARYSLAQLKEQGTEELVQFLQRVREELNSIPQIAVLEHDMQDPLKITLQTRCSLSGFELQKVFEEQGVYTELADPYNVLLVMPLTVNEVFIYAVRKLKEALQSYTVQGHDLPSIPPGGQPFSALAIGYKDLERLSVMHIPLVRAEGAISAEMIIPYPPGIPLVMRGERVTKEQIRQLQLLIETGARFQGAASIQEGKLAVYDI